MTNSEMKQSQAETALYTSTTGYGDKEILSWPNRGATGFSLGIIELTANIPFAYFLTGKGSNSQALATILVAPCCNTRTKPASISHIRCLIIYN